MIAKTGFLVSLTSYVCFWIFDFVRPGFVSRYFSVHVFLLASIAFGIWWSSVVDEYTDRIRLQRILMILSGVGLMVGIWRIGGVFGGWVGLLSFVGLWIPFLTWRLIKYK